ncbi:H-NS histone family protein [Bowmanella pacifica]|uniref:DNA-binding protein n=1 Tax=Bowmanella pacifica TaxID=502051 RepID=A0A917YSK5_9ALTE|nr:H-NS family nucleoid-associated regulatory protein [Bowmanella pacifica]GGO65328.1 DNA-binding protein [Bowmanella pacifica]
MSDFLNILTHARRLQAAVKELSTEELVSVSDKLQSIIETRKALEAEEAKELEKKAALRAALLKQMQDAGISLDELSGEAPSAKAKVKRPVKYKLVDSEGTEHTWTGIGRMPKAFAAAQASGKKLEDLAI